MTIDNLVSDFHHAMNIPVADKLGVPTDERVRLRARLITEEYIETMQALFPDSPAWTDAISCLDEIVGSVPKVDLVELADGLCDLDYVVAGTRLEFGIPGEAVLAEVHAANMRKASGPVRKDGKKLKPVNWVGPDIKRAIGLEPPALPAATRLYEVPRRLKRNRVRCGNCKQEIESEHRHDFRTCLCGETLIDGGLELARVGYAGSGYEDLCEYEDEP